MRSLSASALVVLLTTFLLTAQEAQTIKPPIHAIVFTKDGSINKVIILDETITVATKYGTLEVPLCDVSRIEFGLRFPDGLEQKIVKCMKILGSDVYQEREQASKFLVQANRFSYPLVKKAVAHETDTEKVYRMDQVLKEIERKHSADFLASKDKDVVTSTEMEIIGRIKSQTIKVHSPIFGDVALGLAEVSRIDIAQAAANETVNLDAANHGDQWLKTDFVISPSTRLVVTAQGTVDLWPEGPGQYMATPKGHSTTGKGGRFPAGSLIGRIGENGKPFLLGERYDSVSSQEGRLFLQIVPSPWGKASTGKYQVAIATKFELRR